MYISNSDRARILVHALPYIKKYSGKVVVIKYGGNAMVDEQLKDSVMRDVVLLSLIGVKVVLVHGGGPEINEMLDKIGKESVFKDGLRVTDDETMDVVQMVLAGKINKSLVNLIQCRGGSAMGLCGVDGHMMITEPKGEQYGHVGNVVKVDPKPIMDILDRGYIPVVSTVGCDEDGNVFNVNADSAASKIAAAVNAESFILLTDTAGILYDKNDPSTLVPHLSIEEAEKFKEEGIINGGMIPKIDCCMDAINSGINKVFIIDGRIPHSLLIEMLTDEGIGTMFEK